MVSNAQSIFSIMTPLGPHHAGTGRGIIGRYFSFWFSATATTANWYAASTGLTAGLSVWESVGCTLAGQILAGVLLALNGRAGAVYRIPFPVFCRSSFGVYGAYWPTFNRAVMSIVWNGVTTVQGAQCV